MFSVTCIVYIFFAIAQIISGFIQEPPKGELKEEDIKKLENLAKQVRVGIKGTCWTDERGAKYCYRTAFSPYEITSRLLDLEFEDESFERILVHEMRKQCRVLGVLILDKDDKPEKYKEVLSYFFNQNNVCQGVRGQIKFEKVIEQINSWYPKNDAMRYYLTKAARELCPKDDVVKKEFTGTLNITPERIQELVDAIFDALLNDDDYKKFFNKRVICKYDSNRETMKRNVFSFANGLFPKSAKNDEKDTTV